MHFLIFLSCREDEVGMDLKRAEESGDGARNKVRWGPVLVEKVIRVSHLEAIGVNQNPSRTKKDRSYIMPSMLLSHVRTDIRGHLSNPSFTE